MDETKKVILFDIDHTLFNTQTYRTVCFSTLLEKLEINPSQEILHSVHEAYQEVRKRGIFNPEFFLNQLGLKLHIPQIDLSLKEVFFDEEVISQSLYPDVVPALHQLSVLPHVVLGIFSAGQDDMQRKKIQSFIHLFQRELIYINEVDKLQDIPEIVAKHKDENLFVIDDLSGILAQFKKYDKSVTTILIERDGKNKLEDKSMVSDFRLENLQEIRTIIA